VKKTSLFILAVFVSIIFLSHFILAKEDFDLQTIKKAVKKNPQYKKGREVQWFKLLIKKSPPVSSLKAIDIFSVGLYILDTISAGYGHFIIPPFADSPFAASTSFLSKRRHLHFNKVGFFSIILCG